MSGKSMKVRKHEYKRGGSITLYLDDEATTSPEI